MIEILAALCGIAGTVLLALNGKHAGWGFVAYLGSNAGWIAFAWLHSHWALLAQQLAFTASSALGIWVWLIKPALHWHEWRGDFSGNPTMYIRTLARFRGCKLDVHRITATDAAGCFHTHPANAIRVILWNGYVEEMEDGTTRTWRAGSIGLVRPELSHRIAMLNTGPSWSLWLRGRKTHEIQLRGDGWPEGSTAA